MHPNHADRNQYTGHHECDQFKTVRKTQHLHDRPHQLYHQIANARLQPIGFQADECNGTVKGRHPRRSGITQRSPHRKDRIGI